MKRTGPLRQTIPLDAFVATCWTVPLQRSPIETRPPVVVRLRASRHAGEVRADLRDGRASGKGGLR